MSGEIDLVRALGVLVGIFVVSGMLTQSIVDVFRGAFAWCRRWRARLVALCVGAVVGTLCGLALASLMERPAGSAALVGLIVGAVGGGHNAMAVALAKRKAKQEAAPPSADF